MSDNQVRESWSKTRRWYREAKGHRFPPTREHVDQTSTLWEELYRHCPPEGEGITILVQPLSIEDGPPEVGYIAATVSKIQSGRAGGPSRMKAEHLKAWLQAATR